EGTRLNTLYEEIVPADELPQLIRGVLSAYRHTRQDGERIGDWADRVGVALIHELTEQLIPA
ncbi:MAG: hypothetical protein KDE31_28725, partial [Caldilineaceae bacterium]|nr:hypothetical protein [Caldilineaceae bacterium]